MTLDDRVAQIMGSQILRIAQLEATVEQLQIALNTALEKAVPPRPDPPPDGAADRTTEAAP